jgi:hypothetical protein
VGRLLCTAALWESVDSLSVCQAPMSSVCPGHVCPPCLLVLPGLKLYLGRCSHLLAACTLACGPRGSSRSSSTRATAVCWHCCSGLQWLGRTLNEYCRGVLRAAMHAALCVVLVTRFSCPALYHSCHKLTCGQVNTVWLAQLPIHAWYSIFYLDSPQYTRVHASSVLSIPGLVP